MNNSCYIITGKLKALAIRKHRPVHSLVMYQAVFVACWKNTCWAVGTGNEAFESQAMLHPENLTSPQILCCIKNMG